MICAQREWDILIFARVWFLDYLFERGNSQSPVSVHFWHLIISFPRYFITHLMASTSTLHPALHKVTIDTSDRSCRPGIMCAMCTCLGSCGRASSHVWVDMRKDPFGSVTQIGLMARCFVWIGASETRNELETPESKMAHFIQFFSVKVIFGRSDVAAYV